MRPTWSPVAAWACLAVAPLFGMTTPPPVPVPVRSTATAWPANAPFDYQLGGDYPPPVGVEVVSRDWFAGEPLTGGYSLCYVNAFQTQDDEADIDRPDERSNWPTDLVLGELGDDPEWGGEYLIDISTPASRTAAAAWLRPMIEECARKGFDAVELDNLDSWTRFFGTPLATAVPFGRDQAVDFAIMLTAAVHDVGLAAAQKNTVEMAADATAIGFDLAVVEQCGAESAPGYDECTMFGDAYGSRFVVIEYTDEGFERACRSVGADVSVVSRDLAVTPPGSPTYVYDEC